MTLLETTESNIQSPSVVTNQDLRRRVQPSLVQQMLGLWQQRSLLFLMVQRDQTSRYKGSLLGRFWPLLNPLGQLLIYTFVFSIVLKVRFGDNPSTGSFAIYLMSGMIPWSAFSEAVSRSTTLILENPNLVSKVVFPLELLPLVSVFSALCTQVLAMVILFAGAGLYLHTLYPTVLFLPLLVVPLVLFTAGLSWLLASLGVYLRDTRHFIGLLLQAWMYATPILYPSNSVPESYRWVLAINPMSGIVDDVRRVLLENMQPDWPRFACYTLACLCVCLVGFTFFVKTKKSFADVM